MGRDKHRRSSSMSPARREKRRRSRLHKMAPPKYGDLGKQANDVFSKGYHFGLLKLEVCEFSVGKSYKSKIVI